MTPNAPAPSRSHRAIIAALAGVLLLSGCCCAPSSASTVPPAAEAAAPPPTTSELGEICDQAEDFIEAEEWAKAIAIIDDVREPAREVLVPLATNAPVVDAALACEPQRLAAELGQATEVDAPKTEVEAFGSAWDDAVKAWLTPLTGSGIALLALWAGILLLARLLVFVPRPSWLVWSRELSRLSVILGTSFAVIAPPLLVNLVSQLGKPVVDGSLPTEDIALLCRIAGVIVWCLVASVLLSLHLGGTNRMTVTSTDEEVAPALHAGIVSRLGALGPSGPRDLEVPKGTGIPSDVVKDLLPALAGNVFVAGLQSALRALLGVAPWHVDFRTIDPHRSVVNVTRNGHGFASATIDTTKLELPEKHDDAATFALKLAAAVVLAAMAKTHHDFDGVAGATDWRSIGLTDIATTSFAKDDVLALEALGRALDYDPDNRRAAIALKNRQYRDASDIPTLALYLTWLNSMADTLRVAGEKRSGYTDLRRQVLVTYLAIARNLYAAIDEDAPKDDTSRRPDTKRVISRLVELIDLVADSTPESAGFRNRVRPVAATTVALICEKFAPDTPSKELARVQGISRHWLDQAHESGSPQVAYAYACYLIRGASTPPITADGELLDDVRERLTTAFLDPDTREWAKTDPELFTVRSVEAFQKLVGVGSPPESFWDLDAFGALKEKLIALGAGTPASLVTIARQPKLAKALGISQPALAQLVRIAGLAKIADSHPDEVGKFRVPVVEALVERGINSSRQLTKTWVENNEEEIEKIRGDLTKKYLQVPDSTALRDWLRSIAS